MKEIQHSDIVDWIPIRPEATYKNLLGHVLCIGGSSEMGGAIMMSSQAAVYSGAGLVTVSTHQSNKTALHTRLPEAMFTDINDPTALAQAVKRADTILIGPGLGDSPTGQAIVLNVLDLVTSDQVLVMDADALNIYSKYPQELKAKATIMTPHLGEWERLTGLNSREQNPKDNLEKANELGVIAVVKSHQTQVYTNGEVYFNPAGNPAMSTGGMGDTLAGMIAAFIYQYQSIDKAVLSAVYLHSYIGDLLGVDQYVVLPTDIIEKIPYVMRNLVNEKLENK